MANNAEDKIMIEQIETSEEEWIAPEPREVASYFASFFNKAFTAVGSRQTRRIRLITRGTG